MAKVAATLSFSTIAAAGGSVLACQLPPIFFSPSISIPKLNKPTKIHAKRGGGDGEVKPSQKKKKFITKEEEPDQYWQTAGERKGENPMKTPLPYIIIFGMSTPFIILAIAFANGWIKVPVR